MFPPRSCPTPSHCEVVGPANCRGVCKPPADALAWPERQAARLPAGLQRMFRRAPPPEPAAPLDLAPFLSAAALIEEHLMSDPIPTSAPPTPPPAAARSSDELRIATVPGFEAVAGAGWIVGVGDAPIAVAATPEALGAVVTAWARRR